MIPPSAIDNRSMEYCYTKKLLYKREYTYTEDTSTPTLIDNRCME